MYNHLNFIFNYKDFSKRNIEKLLNDENIKFTNESLQGVNRKKKKKNILRKNL